MEGAKVSKKYISCLQKLCHQIAVEKGFYENYCVPYNPSSINNRPLPELIALMHSELSEALEAIRHTDEDKNNVGEEFADTVIRIMDTCEYLGINLEEEITKKISINKTREFKHGKTF